MKLITLNTWAGFVYEPLSQFIEKYKDDIDVFCFQEIFHTNTENKITKGGARGNLHNELVTLLPNHNDFFSPAAKDLEDGGRKADYPILFGLDTFIRKDILLKNQYATFVYNHIDFYNGEDLTGMPRNIQVNQVEYNGKIYTIFNFHGLWNGQGKSDTEDRISQSIKVKEEMSKYTGPKILCGDFNLLPDTESIKILEEGMRNLVTEYKVTSTRSSLYTKPLKFADYILVSPDVEVVDFKVLQDEVSDHLPLYIELK